MRQQKHHVRYHILAKKACETTQAFYEEKLKALVEEKYPNHSFATRISPNDTPQFSVAIQPESVGGKAIFRISYSERAMSDKEGPDCEWRAGGWATFKEIEERGFAGGVLMPETLILHTLCHEIAHFVDLLVNGEKEKGKSHDSDFYSVLQRFYEDGTYEWLRDDYLDRLKRIGITKLRQLCILPEAKEVVPSRNDFGVGDRVYSFHRDFDNQLAVGVIVKKNPKRAVVAFGRGPNWRDLPMDMEGEDLKRWADQHSKSKWCIHYSGLVKHDIRYLLVA